MSPIFINRTREVDCIIQNGVRYCEKEDLSSKAVGASLLVMLAICAYLVFITWIYFEVDNLLVIVLGVGAPLLVLGLMLI